MIAPLELRVLPVARLIPAEYNPRRPLAPADKAHRKLRASVRRFGLVEPLVWNELTGRVVGGHLRLSVLKELGVAEVPVSVVRLGEADEKALNVVLNNAEAQGRYDVTKLKDVLDELHALGDLDATGFDHSALALLAFEPTAEPPSEGRDADRVEVTLVMPAAAYDRLAPDLDALVREHDLESHVRRG